MWAPRGPRVQVVPHSALLRALVALLLFVGGAPRGAAQERQGDGAPHEVPRELQAEINRAIERGVETLLEQQELDGSWRHDINAYGVGATGLVVYTLLKSGLSAEHPAIVRAFEFIQRHPATRTYSISTVMMALAARGDTKDRRWMEELAERLIEWRQPAGWGYPDNRPDLSNTQFAGLALRAADALGVDLKQKNWDKLADITLEYVESVRGTSYDPAGFYYERGGEPLATGSMTSAGLTLIAICLEHVQGNKQALIIAQKRALVWFARNFSVEFNPKPGSESGRHGWDHYYLYGLERVGSLLGIETFGEHAWYELGARRLVKEQNARGLWGGQHDTCFALLFLSRATAKSAAVSGAGAMRAPSARGLFGDDDPKAEVSLRASGTRELTIWISSFGDRVVRMYAPDEEGKRPLPVKRVEYSIAEVPGDLPLESFATIVVDPTAVSNGRFPVQHTPIGPATYDIVASVTLVDIADGSDVTLTSKPLRVRVGLTPHPDLLTYASDADRNDLRDLTITTTASSQQEGADYAPDKAIDDLQGTGWRAAADDLAPWLRLEFERPPRAGTLVLSTSFNPAEDRPAARATRVQILLNNDPDTSIEADLERDPRRKTRIALPRNLRLRSLELRLFGIRSGNTGPGFNEIELQSTR